MNREKKEPINNNVEIVSDEVYYNLAKELKATESSSEIFINLWADIMFDNNQATLTPQAAPLLEKAVKIMNAKGTGNVMVTGFSDDRVEPEVAQKLSTDRASAVANWIKQQELKSDIHISSQGVGNRFGLPNKNPDGSDNPENQAKNRRIEIVIKKSKLPKQ